MSSGALAKEFEGQLVGQGRHGRVFWCRTNAPANSCRVPVRIQLPFEPSDILRAAVVGRGATHPLSPRSHDRLQWPGQHSPHPMQRPLISRRAVVFLLLLAPALARAGQTVAVLPFRDLAGAKASVGEAIRETVTSDLKDVPGLQVLERGFIDKIIAEQKLHGQGDVDPATSVKIGKLLGATLLVAGAYQRAGTTVRLTARFVRVETGEIVGTAKVDGPATDFLMLQDQVTAAPPALGRHRTETRAAGGAAAPAQAAELQGARVLRRRPGRAER